MKMESSRGAGGCGFDGLRGLGGLVGFFDGDLDDLGFSCCGLGHYWATCLISNGVGC